MVTAKRSGVPARGHPVQLDRIRVAEHEVEDPSAVHVEPVVGQLLTADLVVHQPRATRPPGLTFSVWDSAWDALGQSLCRRR